MAIPIPVTPAPNPDPGNNNQGSFMGGNPQQLLQNIQSGVQAGTSLLSAGLGAAGLGILGALGGGGSGGNSVSGSSETASDDAGVETTSTSDGTGVKVRNVNPPLTPDQIIGLYNTPVQQPALPTLKLQDIRVPNIKNRTLQSHLKAIEAKMIMTEKLMKDIVKFQKYQIVTERQLNERKRELYQNTFEEYLLDKTVGFEDQADKNKNCVCINLPALTAAVPAAPVVTPPPPPPPPDTPAPDQPTPQTRTRTPISQPSIPPTQAPEFLMKQAERTDSLLSVIPWLTRSRLGPIAGVAGTVQFTQNMAKAWYQYYMDQERKYIRDKIKQILKLSGNNRVGELNNLKIIKQRAAQYIQTPQAQKGPYTPSKYWKEAHPEAAVGKKIEEFFQTLQGGNAEMHQFVAQSDYNITSNILNGFGTDYGEIRTQFTEEVIKQGKYDPKDTRSEGRVIDQKGDERLRQLDPGMPAAPQASATTPPVNFASGGFTGDLELYNSQSQNYFRNLSNQIASDIPLGPHTPLPHPGYVRPQGGHIPRPNLRGMPGPMGNPMPWGWQPTLLAKGGVVKPYAGGGFLQQLGRFLPGTGTVMAPKGGSLGFQNKLLGINLGDRKVLSPLRTYKQSDVNRYNSIPSAPSTLVQSESWLPHVSVPKTRPVSPTPQSRPITSRAVGLADALSNQSEQKQAQINEILGKNDKTMTWGQANQELGNRLGWSTRAEQMNEARKQGLLKSSGGITNYASGGMLNFYGQSNVTNKSSFLQNRNYNNSTRATSTNTSSANTTNTNSIIPKNFGEQKISLKLEQSQQQMNQNGPVTPTVIPLPPDYISIPMPSNNSQSSNKDSLLQPPGQDDIISSIFSIESGKYG